jgi:hypothetical protein
MKEINRMELLHITALLAADLILYLATFPAVCAFVVLVAFVVAAIVGSITHAIDPAY